MVVSCCQSFHLRFRWIYGRFSWRFLFNSVGWNSNGTNGFLRESVVLREHLRFSAKICASHEKRKSAKISENLRKAANLAPFVPLSLSLLVRLILFWASTKMWGRNLAAQSMSKSRGRQPIRGVLQQQNNGPSLSDGPLSCGFLRKSAASCKNLRFSMVS